MPDQSTRPTAREMLEEVIDLLGGGLPILLLPLLVTSLPGVILFIIAPAVLVLALVALPVVVAGMLALPPYLLVRAIRRRRRV
jgi:Flp pilus assembly protein TadB